MHSNPTARYPIFPGINPKIRCLWLGLLGGIVVLLSGCIHYELGVNFDDPNHGVILQQIQIGEQLQNVHQVLTRQWIEQLQQRARKVGGSAQVKGDQTLIVSIPFGNGSELTEKFNFFYSKESKLQPPKNKDNLTAVELPDIAPHIDLRQRNFLLFVRNRLHLELDLRGLGIALTNPDTLNTIPSIKKTNPGTRSINPSSLVQIEFKLHTPWGAQPLSSPSDTVLPRRSPNGKTLIWGLQLGQMNYLDAIFWLPSPLGWGTVGILLLVGVGRFLRYQVLPPSHSPNQTIISEGEPAPTPNNQPLAD